MFTIKYSGGHHCRQSVWWWCWQRWLRARQPFRALQVSQTIFHTGKYFKSWKYSSNLQYDAASPDEKALIEACASFGVQFLGEESKVRKYFNSWKYFRRRQRRPCWPDWPRAGPSRAWGRSRNGVEHSHWSMSIEILCSDWFRSCFLIPWRHSKSEEMPLVGALGCFELCLYDTRELA